MLFNTNGNTREREREREREMNTCVLATGETGNDSLTADNRRTDSDRWTGHTVQ